MKLSTKIAVAFTILIVIIVGYFILGNKSSQKTDLKPTNTPSSSPSQSDQPQIISTKPDPLENAVISAANPIEITFNIPLQNVPEFRFRLEPKTDVKVELSSDRKTAKIIPTKPWNLGSGFTLYIQPETKFDGVGEWKQDKTYHFGTIKYTGV